MYSSDIWIISNTAPKNRLRVFLPDWSDSACPGDGSVRVLGETSHELQGDTRPVVRQCRGQEREDNGGESRRQSRFVHVEKVQRLEAQVGDDLRDRKGRQILHGLDLRRNPRTRAEYSMFGAIEIIFSQNFWRLLFSLYTCARPPPDRTL